MSMKISHRAHLLMKLIKNTEGKMTRNFAEQNTEPVVFISLQNFSLVESKGSEIYRR